MIKPSNAVGMMLLQAIANFLDDGGGFATFFVYDDAKPTNIATSANASAKLAELKLPKPCLLQVNADHIELKPTDTATILKSGTATWARLISADGTAVFDFEIGTDITLNNSDWVIGGTQKFDVVVLRLPL